MKAAVMRANDAPLNIEEISIASPDRHEVLVRTAASGICHSDLHVIEGGLPVPPPTVLGHEPAGIVEAVGADVEEFAPGDHVIEGGLPVPPPTVLGHEPAGIVEAVGADVEEFAPGDHVIGCVSAWCGSCGPCLQGRPYLCARGESFQRPADGQPRLSDGGGPIHQFANLSSFAEQMLTHERALVKIDPSMPLDRAALIGCGVTTGMGAALNTARVTPGSDVAIIGCGGVGLAALQGCRIAGAGRIIAVDTAEWKLRLACELGASDTVSAGGTDPIEAVRELTFGGVDYAFECIGLPATVQQAIEMARPGGAAVLVGVVPFGTMVDFHQALVVLQEKRILGSMMGSNRFRLDMPKYVSYYLDGRLDLDRMISRRIGLDDVNDAIGAMKKGEVARSVITFAP